MSDEPWPPRGHLIIEQHPSSAVTLTFDTEHATFSAWDLVGNTWVNDAEQHVGITRDAWWNLIAKLRAGVPTEMFEELRGRYQAVVHDRDRLQRDLEGLQAERERWSKIYEFRFLCELRERAGVIGACQRVLVIYAPEQSVAISVARGLGWGLDGNQHHCATCWARIK